MKTLARLVCISTLFVAPVARIGAGDDKQIAPSLFDQVREAIPKLKPGMSNKQVERLLHLDKLEYLVGLDTAIYRQCYGGFGKESQRLVVIYGSDPDGLIGATLRDGDKIVAQFRDPKR